MKPLIAILTALHVLAHGVFGCCDQNANSSASASAPHHCVCHHADHHGHPSVGVAELVETELPAKAPHECIHDSCHWMVGDSAFKLSLSDVSLAAVYSAALWEAGAEAQATAIWPDDEAGALFAPPVRLHLALGVILA